MKTLIGYINEDLSPTNLTKLQTLVNDDNFEKCYKAITNFLIKSEHSEYSKKYFTVLNSLSSVFTKPDSKVKTNKTDAQINAQVKKKGDQILEIIRSFHKNGLKHNTQTMLFNKIDVLGSNTYVTNVKSSDSYSDEAKQYYSDFWKKLKMYYQQRTPMIGGMDDKENITLADFLNEKGLDSSKIKWGATTPEHAFLDIFSDNMEVLQSILDKKAGVPFDTFKKLGMGNTNPNFIDNFCSGFKDEALKIANITYVKAAKASSAIGPFEILFKFLINEATSGDKGDVSITGKNGGEMEVKNGYGKSGAHICGQKTFKHISVVYSEINKVFKDYKIDEAQLLVGENNKTKRGYFQTADTEKKFTELFNMCIANEDTKYDFIYDLAKALCTGVGNQYNEDMSAFETNVRGYLVRNYINADDNNTLDPSNIRNVLCGIQLMAYAKQEKFDYFCVSYLHTENGGVSSDSRNGEYRILDKKQLTDISEILKYLSWAKIECTDNTMGYTGKLCLNKL